MDDYIYNPIEHMPYNVQAAVYLLRGFTFHSNLHHLYPFRPKDMCKAANSLFLGIEYADIEDDNTYDYEEYENYEEACYMVENEYGAEQPEPCLKKIQLCLNALYHLPKYQHLSSDMMTHDLIGILENMKVKQYEGDAEPED